jgi:hypothetical protein
MAHTYGNASTRASSAATTITTATFTPTSGSTCLVLELWVQGGTNRSGGAPTYNGVTLVQANSTQKAAASPESSVEIWRLPDGVTPVAATASIPNSGAATVHYTFATGKAGSGTVSAYDNATGSNGTSTNPSCGAMTVAANSITFAAVASGAQTFAPSARTGTSIEEADIGATGLGAQYATSAGGGSQTMSWTFGTSDDWGAVAVSFKEVTPPPQGSGTLTLTLGTAGVGRRTSSGSDTETLTLGATGAGSRASSGSDTETLMLGATGVGDAVRPGGAM